MTATEAPEEWVCLWVSDDYMSIEHWTRIENVRTWGRELECDLSMRHGGKSDDRCRRREGTRKRDWLCVCGWKSFSVARSWWWRTDEDWMMESSCCLMWDGVWIEGRKVLLLICQLIHCTAAILCEWSHRQSTEALYQMLDSEEYKWIRHKWRGSKFIKCTADDKLR